MHKLSVNLVTWNGAKYMPYLFDSLKKQTYTDWTLLVIDNNSGDGTVELIKKEMNPSSRAAEAAHYGASNFPVPWKIIENKTNLGFAGGHNQAFKESDAEYVLLLNQDMYLTPDCLEKIIAFLDKYPEAASVSPRLMKWNFDELNEAPTTPNPSSGRRGNLEKSFSEQIDALGLKVYRNRRVVEQYAQEDWDRISPLPRGSEEGVAEVPTVGKQTANHPSPLLGNEGITAIEVFGVSGALPAFRRSAINSVAYSDGSIFDESYHSYKEDVDLAWRLASAGHKSYVILDTVAYHDRSAAGPKYSNDAHALANKKQQSEWVKYHSYKNHLMTLYKNEYWQNFALDFPWILWYELKKLVYFLLFDRRVLWGLKDLFGQDLWKKRRFIKSRQKLSWQEMRQWWKS